MTNISVLVSGGGSNLQAIMDGISSGLIEDAKITMVISSSESAYAIERAENAGIPVKIITNKRFPDENQRTEELLKALREAKTDLIVLAGYLKIIPPQIVKEYRDRIINIHPSLIPKHCGEGFYGKRVHESVLAEGDKESGATVHFVDEGVDTGRIIIQEKVPVYEDDTAELLAARVLEVEHKILVCAVNEIMKRSKR